MIGKLTALLLFCVCFIGAEAQQPSRRLLDSVTTIALKSNPDTNSMTALSELQRYYFNLAIYDSALHYSRYALSIMAKAGTSQQHARTLYNNGLIFMNRNQYDSAIYYLDEAERKAMQVKDTSLAINIINANGLLSNYQSDYKSAIEFHTKAATLAESRDVAEFRDWLPQLYGNIGHNLIAEKQLEKGIAYEKKALLFKNFTDEKRYRPMIHLDIADAYIKLGQSSLAKLYLDSAAGLLIAFTNPVLQTMLHNSEGLYYESANEMDASLQAYLKAYHITDSSGNRYMRGEAADNLAKAYFKTSNLAEAEKYATEGNKIAAEFGAHTMRANTYEILKKIATAKKQYELAVKMGDLQKLYADSASTDASRNQSLYLEARYQNAKKENDIASLTIANKNNELEVLQRNKILLTGGIISAALLLLMGLLYRQSRHKRLIAEKDAILQQEQVKFLERQQQVVSLQSMVNGQETERTRIAKDLHDGLGGLFSTTKMYFSTLQHEQPGLKENQLFLKSYEMVNTASEEVRRIAHNMMPEVLIKMGLLQAVQELCNSISAGKLLTVTLQTYGMEQRLGSSTEIMLFRIIQELLNNVIKHARASEALIQFNREGNRLSIIVEDNGSGFNTALAEGKQNAGLESVKSRVTYLNGRLSIDSQKQSGTTVMMDFLLNEEN